MSSNAENIKKCSQSSDVYEDWDPAFLEQLLKIEKDALLKQQSTDSKKKDDSCPPADVKLEKNPVSGSHSGQKRKYDACVQKPSTSADFGNDKVTTRCNSTGLDDFKINFFKHDASKTTTSPTTRVGLFTVQHQSIVDKQTVTANMFVSNRGIGKYSVTKGLPQPSLRRVYVESADETLILQVNQKMRKLKMSNEVEFVDTFSSRVNHYVMDYALKTGPVLSYNYYLAKTMRVWILYPAWFNHIRYQLAIPDPKSHEYLRVDNVGEENRSLSMVNRNYSLFGGYEIIFINEFPFVGFPFKKQEISKLVSNLGASVNFYDLEFLKVELIKEVSTLRQKPGSKGSFVVATTCRSHQTLTNDLFAKFQWKAVRPQYILACIERNRIFPVPSKEQLTTQIVIAAKS